MPAGLRASAMGYSWLIAAAAFAEITDAGGMQGAY